MHSTSRVCTSFSCSLLTSCYLPIHRGSDQTDLMYSGNLYHLKLFFGIPFLHLSQSAFSMHVKKVGVTLEFTRF